MSARLRLLVAVISIAIVGLSAPAMAVASTATTTTLAISPASGDSATIFHLTATVTPNPAGGEVRLTDWTAQSGGTMTWDHTFNVNSNGVAAPQGIQLDPGTHWWQAEFVATPNFGGSISVRKSVTVSGLPSTLSNVSLAWSTSSIDFRGHGAIGDGNMTGGSIELVVDNEVHASCWQWSSSATVSCSGPNNLAPGHHTALVRFVPLNPRYGASSSPAQDYWNGPPLPPSSGIRIEADRFATNSLDVNIDVAAGPDSVRLSNTPDVDGSGALVGGTTFSYLARLPWTLAAGSDGWRTVYAQHIALDGTASPATFDSIFLDTTAPTGSFVIDGDAPTVGDPWANTVYDQRLTGWASDDSSDVGGEITNMAVSNDAKSWWVIAYETHTAAPPPPPPGPGPTPTPSPTPTGSPPIALSFDVLWQVAADWWGGDGFGAGVKTVYVKWRDAAGNWSAPVTDQITQVDGNSIAQVLIDGEISNKPNPHYTSNAQPQLTIQVAYPPEEGLDRVVIRAEPDAPAKTIDWPSGANELVVPWSLTDTAYGYTAGDGVKDVHVQLLSTTGRHNDFGGTVILDRGVATSGSPVPAFALGTVVTEQSAGDGFGVSAASKLTFIQTDIQWKSSGTSATAYDLERLLSGAWNDVGLTKPTATKARQQVSAGATDQFRVQTTYSSGDHSQWKTGPPFSAAIYQDDSTALTYSGKWSIQSRTDALGTSVRSAKAAGASVKLTFTGRAVAWLAPRMSLGGTASVYVDGRLIKNVGLSSTDGTYQPRYIVFSMSWKNSGTHTIKIVKKYTAWNIAIDALLVLK